jgi:hypothetical protein
MSRVPRKGLFILTADGTRREWAIEGPHFGGWEVYHCQGAPAAPDRLLASASWGWFGQLVHGSDDGGAPGRPRAFAYGEGPATQTRYDGPPHPWAFQRVWHFRPAPGDPDDVYAGVEDAALFRSRDGGQTWTEVSALRRHTTGASWQPGAAACTRCCRTRRSRGACGWRSPRPGSSPTEDGGETWCNRGLRLDLLPQPEADVGHCVHRITMHPQRPQTLFMQKHWDVMRSDDGGSSWREVSGNLPSDFGFALAVHAHEPETVFVVPILSDSLHYPPEARLRVYRSRTGGTEGGAVPGPAAAALLRGRAARGHGRGRSRPLRHLPGDDRGAGYVSADGGDSWAAVVRDLPAVLSVEAQTLP